MRRSLPRLAAVAAVPFALAVALLVSAGASASTKAAASVEAHTPCDTTIVCFVPDSITVDVGDAVTWSDPTGIGHTVTRCTVDVCDSVDGGTGTDETFTSANIDGTHQFTHAFTAPGTYNYYCQIHGFGLMHGIVNVNAPVTTVTTTETTSEPPTSDTTTPTSIPPTTIPGTTQTTVPGSTQTTVASSTAEVAGLARTGDNSSLLLALGCALLAIGVVLTATARRITSTSQRPQ